MKNQILTILIILLSIGFISAIGDLPHGFYGEVYYSDESLIHENLIITAELGNFSDTCIIQNGTYGYGEDTLIVQSENKGGIVYFYIQGVVEPIANFSFQILNVTELNLITPLISPNLSIENNDSTNHTNSGSSSGGRSSSGGGDISNNEYMNLDDKKESSFEGFGFLNLNENSPINSFVMRFINYGPIITFVFLIGILTLLFIIIKKSKR